VKTLINYAVEVIYEPEFYPKYDTKIIKALGSPHGTGMGVERDLCWIFMQDKESAYKFLKKAKTKLRGLKLKAYIVKYASSI
jgi:hypothetical protein